MADPKWLERARRLQVLAQTGLHYTKDPFDRERYEEIRALAAEMMASRSHADEDFIRNLFARQTGYATPKVDVRGAVLTTRFCSCASGATGAGRCPAAGRTSMSRRASPLSGKF